MAIKDKINAEDFVIQVKPMLNPSGRWTGEVDVSVISSTDNPLIDEDYYGVLEFCRMICASIPLMEKDEDLKKRAAADHWYQSIYNQWTKYKNRCLKYHPNELPDPMAYALEKAETRT